MTEKKSFVLYKDQRQLVAKLSDSERGKLFLAVYDYAIEGIESTLPPKADLVFTAIKADLDRDLEKYDKLCVKRSELGKLGARIKKQKQANASNSLNTQANQADNDNVNDNDNENDNDNDNDNENDNVNDNDNDNDNDNVNVNENINNKPTARRSRKSEAFGDKEKVKKILSYLNEKTDSEFSAESEATQRHINARLREGYKEEDFITVIDKKVDEWKGTDYEKYLRPSTLFGSKFEDYLYQKKTVKRDYYVAPGEDDILPF